MTRHFRCTVAGCDGLHYGKGFCLKHWNRWRRYGDPMGGGPSRQWRKFGREQIGVGVTRCPHDEDQAA